MALQTKTYSAGSFAYGSDSNAYVLDLILTEDAVSQGANTSVIFYKLQLRSGSSNRFQWDVTASLTLNGTKLGPVTANRYLDYNSTWVLLSGSMTVPHRADGTLAMPFSAAITVPAGNRYAPPDMTLSGTMALTAIDRESTVSATAATIGGKSTIVIDRKNDSFTHSVHYRFGQLSGYLTDATGTLSEKEVKLSATAIHFPIPETFYSQIPGAPGGECTLTVTTYSGSTRIGAARSDTFSVTADPARCSPLVTGTVEDICEATLALTGDAKRLVRYKSTALCTITAQAQHGASITQRTIGGVPVEENSRIIERVETADIAFRAQDSRGYASTAAADGLTLVEYVQLSCNAAVKRTDPTSGRAELMVAPSRFFAGSFGAVTNSLQLWCTAGERTYTLAPVFDGNTYTASVTLEGLDYQSEHTITVYAQDALESVAVNLRLSKGIPVFDWGENDFTFHVPVSAPSFAGVYPVGGIYMSATDTDPASQLGGTWEKITPSGTLAGLRLWQRTK